MSNHVAPLEQLDQSDIVELFSDAGSSFTFFSQLIFKELSSDAIAELAQASFPEDSGNELLDAGYTLIRRYFAFKSNDPRTELACEYARIFLAAGINLKENGVATPYESVFTSEDGLVMQESRDEVYHWFLQDGFKVEASLHEPEDHLSFELEYVSHMCKRAEQLTRDGALNELQHNLERQESFIKAHLLNWLPLLHNAALSYAKLTFYTGVLLVIEGYLRNYVELLASVNDSVTAHTSSTSAVA